MNYKTEELYNHLYLPYAKAKRNIEQNIYIQF